MAFPFDESEIRDAEQALEAALEASDLSWVDHYTDDAMFVAPGSPPVQGREALLELARAMEPLSSVSISPSRTEVEGRLAYTYGEASWVSGGSAREEATTRVRLVIVWRKGSDGRWRVTQEILHPAPESGSPTS